MRYSRVASGGCRDAHRLRVTHPPVPRSLRFHTAAIGDRPRRIYNPVQRDAATFLETSEETGGARTLAELEVAPGGKVTPHYHLTYSERFKVLEGQLTVEIDGVRHELGPDDEAVRNPLHAALVLEMGDVRLPGAYAALERVLGLLVRLARRRGVDRELERRYL
jgi:mannose-6-phosphate isomerase-like protein (cupin superfamily)